MEGNLMNKYGYLAVVVVLAMQCLAADQMKSGKKVAGAPDAAYMQKVLDAWNTLDTSKVAPYYAQGAGHVFFDISPLKYNSWDEYASGVSQMATDLKSLSLVSNDDATVHVDGNMAWGTATVKGDFVHKSGKRDMATYRWTAIWEKQDGKWIIVHDHFSAPMQ
jgi:ketosteroid isomerase-like protein